MQRLPNRPFISGRGLSPQNCKRAVCARDGSRLDCSTACARGGGVGRQARHRSSGTSPKASFPHKRRRRCTRKSKFERSWNRVGVLCRSTRTPDATQAWTSPYGPFSACATPHAARHVHGALERSRRCAPCTVPSLGKAGKFLSVFTRYGACSTAADPT